MKTTQNTILITGGSAGIGFAIAQTLLQKGNTIIITGRDKTRLDNALKQLPGARGIVSDVSKGADVDALVKQLSAEFPTLNVVINNAGRAIMHSLIDPGKSYEAAAEEMATNYLSIIRLNEKVLDLLRKQPEAAIVNVSSIVAFTPNHVLSTYGASKAALHSYSLSLRLALSRTSSVKVFELMPPLVNTEFSEPIGGAVRGIPPADVANALVEAFEKDEYEIHVGNTAYIYQLNRTSPEEALLVMNPA